MSSVKDIKHIYVQEHKLYYYYYHFGGKWENEDFKKWQQISLNQIAWAFACWMAIIFCFIPWKSCNVNGRRCQGLMAAPGMIQTPWYSKDHSSQNLSETETTQSLTKVFKNNIFHIRWKLCWWNEKKKHRKLKKIAHPRQDVQTRHVLPFGNVEVSG